MKNKKAVMGQVISVFVMILIISILAGLTFLFVSQLKDNVFDTSTRETVTVTNETGLWINGTGVYVATADELGFANAAAVQATNTTSDSYIIGANYSFSTAGYLINTTYDVYNNVLLSYTYSRIANTNSYTAVNDTETAGATIVNYLPLIFLAIIFGTILTLVLKIILPYINLGKSFGQFGGEY